MREWIAEQPSTLRAFTDEHDPQASFFFARLLREKEIKINGTRATDAETPLQRGDVVRYYMSREQEEKAAFYPVFEDENFLVVDKESGVNSEAVFSVLQRDRGENIYFLHRLDRNTCGLLLFAKTAAAAEACLAAFKDRSFNKIYHAVCVDAFQKDDFIARAYLTKDRSRSLVRVSLSPSKGAESIQTGYRVLSRRGGLALCEVTLYTGKTHQIRAHSAFLSCPVLGDGKYGDKRLNARYNKTRQCLVSKSLTLHFSADSPFAYADGKTFSSRFFLSLDEILSAPSKS